MDATGSSSSSLSEQLKAEGNTLYCERNFRGAYEKYTQALLHEDKNAILYSNRAACSLGLSK